MHIGSRFTFILASVIMAASQTAPAPESNAVPAYKVDVKLVPVHVVVRDGHGQAVGNLRREDFQLFDEGKAQNITQFSAEHAVDAPSIARGPNPIENQKPRAATGRYTAYLFDDLHLERNDLIQAREAADRQLASLSPGTERAAIFTTSGQKGVDFTADLTRLHDTLVHLEPRGKPVASDCPAMSYFMADLIADKGDQDALQVATSDALACAFDRNPKFIRAARQLAGSAAREKIEIGRVETSNSLRILKALVQGMSKAPGQRKVILISPGIFVAGEQAHVEILDLAVRSDVTISALDPRGLVPSMDIRVGRVSPQSMAYKSLSDTEESAVLEELADGTGGVFFHNNNDVDRGFEIVAGTPEYSYVLAFTPSATKMDGSFHRLKVTVIGGDHFTVQARKGYYAAKLKR